MIYLSATLVCGYTQTISPKVQNSSGTRLVSPSYFIDFSLGELSSIREFISSEKYALSTGFFHADIPLVTALYEQKLDAGEYIVISPNPVSNNLTIKAKYNTPGKFEFKIYDIHSKMVFTIDELKINDYFLDKISLNTLAAGTYFLVSSFEGVNGKRKANVLKFLKL